MAMKAMKGRFLKKLNIISAIKRGLQAHEQIRHTNSSKIAILEGNGLDEDDGFSSSLESMQDLDDDDAGLSGPESLELSLSGAEEELSSDSSEVETLARTVDIAGSVVFYSTSLRGVRKTFDDCSKVRLLLRSMRVRFEEKDVSMHREYRDELWKLSGGDRVVPPMIFIRERLVGGADEVIGLHERGQLRELLQGIPLDSSTGSCQHCGDFRFIICSICSGSCRVNAADTKKRMQCTECNENGLVRCPIC
ncbi:hypothetical protein SAY87_022729 [Trapa incisa]|uniref:Glutaredoxin domain-containing protein n=1 Tax=Trapa incisa TaxID=236973 RepID=A0AAN7K1D3_9MYRT|nr:hypothetical protein SAY87_022729 [Trapa incisa]